MPWITLSIASAAWLAHAAGAEPSLWAYRPAAPTLVQLVACHLVHFSRAHLVWDVVTFVALGAVSERFFCAGYVAFLAAGVLLVPPIACALSPWVTGYGGLSGLVIGQIALWLGAECCRALGRTDRTRAAAFAVLLVGLVAKQVHELHIGRTMWLGLDGEGFTPMPSAHFVSVLVGAISVLFSSTSTCETPKRRRPGVRSSAAAMPRSAGRLARTSCGCMPEMFSKVCQTKSVATTRKPLRSQSALNSRCP